MIKDKGLSPGEDWYTREWKAVAKIMIATILIAWAVAWMVL